MPDNTEERFSVLFAGARGWKSALSKALGYYNPGSLTRALNDPPPMLLVVLELLEATPRKKWPARFDALSALAAKAEAKGKETA